MHAHVTVVAGCMRSPEERMARFLNRNVRTFLATQFRMLSDQVDIYDKYVCLLPNKKTKLFYL